LHFGNYTASGVTSNQILTFQRAVADAASIWGSNVTANLGYITNYMNSYAGISTDEFFIFIETSTNIYVNSWYVYSYGNVLATFTGINPSNPYWSYMFLKGQINKSIRFYTVSYLLGQGSGISYSTSLFVTNLLLNQDTGSSCTCYNTQTISATLNSYDGQSWSVICDEGYEVYAQFEPANYQWIYTKGPNCYYMLWAI
jgi:hypothetical protein